MGATRFPLFVLALAGSAILLSPEGSADETGAPRFKAPVRIRAGNAFLGEGRYYPSPVLHDVDGDGRRDLVVGDLFGKVTVALRTAADSPQFDAEKPLEDRDGRPLKFHNW